jgi:hypothetical protein
MKHGAIRLAGITLALFWLHAGAAPADEAQAAGPAAEAPLMCLAPSDRPSWPASVQSLEVTPSGARPDDAPPPAAAGMRAFLDPQTGRLIAPRPLPPQALAALEQARLRRDDSGLAQQILPNGAILVHLQGRFHNLAVARIEPEGDVSTPRCVTSSETARSLLAAEAERPAAPRASCGD